RSHRAAVAAAPRGRGNRMRRRAFIAGLGAVAVSPFPAAAQQPAPLVGFSMAGRAEALRSALAGFEDGLKEAGYAAGQNVTTHYRFADGRLERFPAFIAEFVQREASVIVTAQPGLAPAIKATSTIPIVFSIGEDPVKLGVVPNLNRPGGNVTGVYQFAAG